MKETCILINYKDRPTEVSLALQSLRTQTYQNFDIFILDDVSGSPLFNYHFFNCIRNILVMENHKVFVKRSEFPLGVSRARQEIVDWAINDYKYFVRIDDDVLLNSDYLERLINVINQGYDIASGVTIPCQPTFKRDPKFLKIVNRVILDNDGNFIMNGDDCGMPYLKSVTLPAHHFRSCAMIKKEVHEKVKYYPTKLSMNGFREEEIFSFNALMNGFTIGVDTGAINYHQMTPSGGEKPTMNMVPFNQGILEEFTKEHKDELNKLFTHENMPDNLELQKENNLIKV